MAQPLVLQLNHAVSSGFRIAAHTAGCNFVAMLATSVRTVGRYPGVVNDGGHTVTLERPAAYTDIVREFVTTLCEGDGESVREML